MIALILISITFLFLGIILLSYAEDLLYKTWYSKTVTIIGWFLSILNIIFLIGVFILELKEVVK